MIDELLFHLSVAFLLCPFAFFWCCCAVEVNSDCGCQIETWSETKIVTFSIASEHPGTCELSEYHELAVTVTAVEPECNGDIDLFPGGVFSYEAFAHAACSCTWKGPTGVDGHWLQLIRSEGGNLDASATMLWYLWQDEAMTIPVTRLAPSEPFQPEEDWIETIVWGAGAVQKFQPNCNEGSALLYGNLWPGFGIFPDLVHCTEGDAFFTATVSV